MSVNISVSNKDKTCNDILQKLIKYNINYIFPSGTNRRTVTNVSFGQSVEIK